MVDNPEWGTPTPPVDDAAEKAKAEAEAKEAEEIAAQAVARKAKEDAEAAAAISVEKERAKYEARMSQLEGLLQNKWQAKETPPAPVGPGITDDDFLTPEGARKASQRMAQEAAMKAAVAVDAKHNRQNAAILEMQFEQRYEKLKGKKYFKYIQGDIEDAIVKNPNLRMSPQALDILYNSFVGQRGEEIVEAEKGGDVTQVAPVGFVPSTPDISSRPASLPAPTAPVIPAAPSSPTLSAAEEKVRQKFFEKAGVSISAERWAQIRAERAGDTTEAIPSMEERGR